MANDEHIAQLKKGVAAWNAWREENPDIRPNLREANLREANLRGGDLRGARLSKSDLASANLTEADLRSAWLRWADLSRAHLSKADLESANLTGAHLAGADLNGANLNNAILTGADLRKASLFKVDLRLANLTGAKLDEADLREAMLTRAHLIGAQLCRANLSDANFAYASLRNATLSGANLCGASLYRADLSKADLSKADLRSANLEVANMVNTDLTGADLTGCRIYGVSAWGLKLDGVKQQNLIITPKNEPEIRVEDLEVGQFIYLLLNREKIRNVINTVTRRGVLLLGRFGDGGLAILQAVAAWLRAPENGGYLPLLFDFPRPDSKTYTETVRTLVSLARFVIVDLSGPSVPQEITATVDLYEIPFVPILEAKRKEWSMFRDFLVKERVLEPVHFTDQDHLLKLLAKEVIAPAEKLIEKRQKRLDEIFGRTSP